MKNSKGMSVVSLVVTVIVIIMMTSIVTYNGIGAISSARKKEAIDKLDVICNAIRRDDDLLDLNVVNDVEIDYDELRKFELEKYYNEKRPIYMSKESISSDSQIENIYTLKMYKDENKSEVLADTSFSIIKKLEKNIIDVSFDENRGVNRPLIYEHMYPIAADGESLVADVFEDSWYNYSDAAAVFAKMKYDTDYDGSVTDEDITYIWIPRYAYSIQEYYSGYDNVKNAKTSVPSSAIKVVFLKENTNYMANNEVLPDDYIVHPAFRTNGVELAGIWVAMNTSDSAKNVFNAASDAAGWIPENDNVSSHLMTNTEYAAALYLMFAKNAFNQIDFIEQNEIVAAGVKGVSQNLASTKYTDLYELDASSSTGIVNKVGDAMAETNWDRLTANYPTTANPYVVRLLKSGYFDFTSTDSYTKYHFRAVVVNK